MKVVVYGRSDSDAQIIFNEILGPLEPLDKCVSISFDHYPRQELPHADYRVLLLWEPSVVLPWQYRKENREKFDLVIPMSYWRAKELGYEQHSFQEYEAPAYRISPWISRSKRIVMINSAKFSSSCKSNYGLRRKVSKKLHKSQLGYSLYGDNWRKPLIWNLRKRLSSIKNSIAAGERVCLRETLSELFYKFPEYMGPIERKESVLGDSQLSLVIENQSDTVTEKLFDSIFSGAVPVYVGPSLESLFPSLEKCTIQVSPDANSIVKRIVQVTEWELNQKRKAIEEYLAKSGSDGIEFWKPEKIWIRTAKIIRSNVSSSNRW